MKMKNLMKATLALRTPAEAVSIAGGQPRQSGAFRGPTRKQAPINFMLLILLAGSLLLLPAVVYGTMTPTTAGPTWGIDDWNTSKLNPSPAKKVSTLSYPYCPWINTGMDTFKNSHTGWSYDWASQADMAKVEQGISIIDYYAYVVTQPAVKAGDGNTYPSDFPGINDVGGAVFNLKYTPAEGAHVFTDLHWIQGLYAHYDHYNEGEYQTRLDVASSNTTTPFYDNGACAGTLPGGGGWFLDTPGHIECEGLEKNPVADVQFQVVLADYDSATKAVTLYGGEWWGYIYTASDVPEPMTVVLLGLGGLALRRRHKV